MQIKAKFRVNEITDNGYSDKVKMSAVYGGSAENNTYAAATPCGTLEIQIDNPGARGHFKPGLEYYIDFTIAEDSKKVV